MEQQTDILVVGGGPAGIISAVTARRYYPNKKIMLIKSVGNGCIPCGIPYMFSSLKNPDENKLGDAALEKNNVEIVVDEAVKIDREQRTLWLNKRYRSLFTREEYGSLNDAPLLKTLLYLLTQEVFKGSYLGPRDKDSIDLWQQVLTAAGRLESQ